MKSFEKSRVVAKPKCRVGSATKWAVIGVVLAGVVSVPLLYISSLNQQAAGDASRVDAEQHQYFEDMNAETRSRADRLVQEARDEDRDRRRMQTEEMYRDQRDAERQLRELESQGY